MTKEQIIFGVLSSLVALAALVLGVVNARYSRRRDQESEIDELREELADLKADHRVTQKQISLFWGIVEKEIGNMLHSPHRAELDRLIEKNVRGKLEPNELERFAELLQEMAEDTEATHGEQAAAVLLKAAVLARHAHVNH